MGKKFDFAVQPKRFGLFLLLGLAHGSFVFHFSARLENFIGSFAHGRAKGEKKGCIYSVCLCSLRNEHNKKNLGYGI